VGKIAKKQQKKQPERVRICQFDTRNTVPYTLLHTAFSVILLAHWDRYQFLTKTHQPHQFLMKCYQWGC